MLLSLMEGKLRSIWNLCCTLSDNQTTSLYSEGLWALLLLITGLLQIQKYVIFGKEQHRTKSTVANQFISAVGYDQV